MRNAQCSRSSAARPMSQRLFLMAVTVIVALAHRSAAANTIYVTTTTQKISSTGGCSLQEAIYSANFDNNIAIDSTNPDHFITTECAPGSGDDTIVLPAGALFPMSGIVPDAHSPLGPAATPIIFSNITIEANGARLEHVLNGVNFRAFAVGTASVDTPSGTASGTGNLTVRNVYIRGFTVRGGNGADGGGGGMGAGGAIYVDGSGGNGSDNLTIENSTFEANGAAGGNGSGGAFTAGGGGGGLSGNGGHKGPSGLAGGGGGGGARGHGGDGGSQLGELSAGGGGGGGTVTDGEDAYPPGTGPSGGYRCGGAGGAAGDACIFNGFGGDSGDDGSCPGGGGGGGASYRPLVCILFAGSGGKGNYGGGGGGSGTDTADGGHGGFGGGGGAGDVTDSSLSGFGPSGGDGGFGGGGGAAHGGYISGGPGRGGMFAGDASTEYGGGGAALGGAIFSHFGNVTIRNSTFTGNFVLRGLEGGSGAGRGQDAGGAIFAADGSLTVLNTTVSGNGSTGEGAGIVVVRTIDTLVTSFELRNTIIANNGARECFFRTGVTALGSRNLIQNNFGCPEMVSSSDPQLGPLQLNAPGSTPTMAIEPTSPAVDIADAATSLPTDQRGVARPQGNGYDIGAFEARAPAADLSVSKAVSSSTAIPGDTVTYDIGVTNQGPDAATGVVVSDTLPSALIFTSCQATTGTCGGSGNDRTISYAAMDPSATDTISLAATLNFGVPDGTVVTNTVSVAATSPADPDTSNNSASASFTVQNKADLFLTKSVKKLTTRQLSYMIEVKNLGPYQARRLVLNDPMPNGTNFVSVSRGPWTCAPLPVGSVGTLTCTLASLDLNATATLVLVVKTTAPGSVDIVNTATVSPATFDPNLANNSATLVTRVSGK
jgi:uncharacterized repeat protein (TIGR01451 family)